MDDYKFSSTYNTGWKPVRQDKNDERIKSIDSFNGAGNCELPEAPVPDPAIGQHYIPPTPQMPAESMNDVRNELLSKLNQIQMEVLSLKQILKEIHNSNFERKAMESKPHKSSRFFK